MGTKNFGLQEFTCPCCGKNEAKLELLYALQRARDYLDKNDSISITSGYRCPPYNQSLGAEHTSSHVKGLAADLDITDGGKAFRIVQAIMKTNAFNRIGFGKVNGKLVMHVDVDDSKVQEWLWGY